MNHSHSQATSRVITLNFHGIGQPDRDMEPGEERFWITEDNFAAILQVAVDHSRDVEFTFDDGNASDHTIGLPALIAHGAAARFFIITDRIDTPGSLSAVQVADLVNAGMALGTHGASHRPWPDLAQQDLLGGELDRSTARLAAIAGTPIRHAAFPQGLYNRTVLRELQTRGFERAYSVDEGWSSRRAWLRTRYSVIHSDTPESIRRLLDSPNLTAGRWPMRPLKQAVKRWR